MTSRGWYDPATLAVDIGRNAFLLPNGRAAPRRIGAEVEFLLLDADTRAALPITGEPRGSLPFLRRFGAAAGWIEEASEKGARAFRLPGGMALSYEPGGQIEIRTPPEHNLSRLLERLHAVTDPLVLAAEAEGIAVLGMGIDPRTPLERVPLQVISTRYVLMDRYLRSIGTWGPRMMRQTAAVQINVDFGSTPLEDWRLANALAPYLTALFANSPRYGGHAAGAQSVRALAWRRLDSSRTGIFASAGAPSSAADYSAFALGAGAIFGPSRGGEYGSFRDWLAEGGATAADWQAHLTTLFPEVRPKGYLEVRSIDALSPTWLAAVLCVVGGLLLDPATAKEAGALAGPPDPELLEPAALEGMRHPVIGRRAAELFTMALEGCERLGPTVVSARDVEVARAYGDCYPVRGRSPADDVSG